MKNLFLSLFTLAIFYGYCNNFYQFVKCDFKPSYKAEIIRGVGIITGTGAIMGYIDIEDRPEKN